MFTYLRNITGAVNRHGIQNRPTTVFPSIYGLVSVSNRTRASVFVQKQHAKEGASGSVLIES